jgi:phasin
MANSSKPGAGYDVPPEMREFAERSVEQARKAIDGFMGAARKTVDTLDSTGLTVQTGTKDLATKTFSYAEQNISAAFDLAQRLVRAKDPQEALQLQAEYVRQQFAAHADPDEGIRLCGAVRHGQASGRQGGTGGPGQRQQEVGSRAALA